MKSHKIARKFEDRIACDIGGRRIFLSGAGSEKADVRLRKRYQITEDGVLPLEETALRVEAKTTSRDIYSFRTIDWLDLDRAARSAGEEPIFAISFVAYHQDYVLLRASFAELLGFPVGLPLEIKLSWTLNAPKLLLGQHRRHIRLSTLPGRTCLVVADYSAFLVALRKHERTDPSELAELQKPRGPRSWG